MIVTTVRKHDTSHSKGRFSTVLAIFIFTQLAVVIALLYKHVDNALDPYHCNNFLEHGQWSHDPENSSIMPDWSSSGCIKQEYSPELLKQCLSSQGLQFRGDSTAREVFWAVARKLDKKMAVQKQSITMKHTDIHFEAPMHTIEFVWDPFLNRTKSGDGVNSERVHVTIAGAGLWHALHLDHGSRTLIEGLTRYSQSRNNRSSVKHPQPQLVIIPLTTPIHERLSESKAAKINGTVAAEYNNALRIFDNQSSVEVAWAFADMTRGRPSLLQDDGLHTISEVASIQAILILNRVCSPLYRQKGIHTISSCCTAPHYVQSQKATIWLLCLICLTCTACLMIRRYQSVLRLSSVIRFDFTSAEAHVYLKALSHMCAAILYCYLADRTHLLSTSDKIVDAKLFIFFSVASMLCGVLTMMRSSNNKISDSDTYMSRAQTDEWKGWMQLVILLYHYFGMSRVLWVYQIVRCLIGAYLFLTGYGHALYFIKTNDFSLRRVAAVLIRLNLLAGVLAWAMNTTWDFYYFPALSSFWFLIVYVTLYGRKCASMTLPEVLGRITLSLTFVTVATQTGIFKIGLIQLAHLTKEHYLDPVEAAREFDFRVKLDLLAPYAGIFCATFQTKIRNDSFRIDTRKSRPNVLFILVSALLICSYLYISHSFTTKQTYNRYHALLSLAPILAYMILRNSSPSLRAHHSQIFAWLGRCSLETFVLQYHIWLAMDTKATLHLGLLDLPGASGNLAIVSFASWRYWVEKAFITAVFLWVCDAVAVATNVLVGIIGGRNK